LASSEKPIAIWIGAVLGFLAVATLAWWLLGSSSPEVGKRGSEISLALLGACKLQDEQRLATLANTLEESSAELSEAEYTALSNVIQLAQSGDWSAATRRIQTIMADQAQAVELPELD